MQFNDDQCELCNFDPFNSEGWVDVELYSPEEKILYKQMLEFISGQCEIFYRELDKRFGMQKEIFEDVLERILSERWMEEVENLPIGVYKVIACPIKKVPGTFL